MAVPGSSDQSVKFRLDCNVKPDSDQRIRAAEGEVFSIRVSGYGTSPEALPCISPCGCALLGPFFGMWCVLVLMQEETWQAFGRSRL
jgi:hypothetical protein